MRRPPSSSAPSPLLSAGTPRPVRAALVALGAAVATAVATALIALTVVPSLAPALAPSLAPPPATSTGSHGVWVECSNGYVDLSYDVGLSHDAGLPYGHGLRTSSTPDRIGTLNQDGAAAAFVVVAPREPCPGRIVGVSPLPPGITAP